MIPAKEFLYRTARDVYLSARLLQSRVEFQYSATQLDSLESSFPSLDLAMDIDGNLCVLVPTPPEPMCLIDLFTLFPEHFNPVEMARYSNPYQLFSRDEYLPAAKWLAVRRIPYFASKKSTWAEQIDILPSGLYVPRAVDLIYAMIVFSELKGKCILRSCSNRTASSTLCHEQVVVGAVDSKGIVISHEGNLIKRHNLLNAVGLILE